MGITVTVGTPHGRDIVPEYVTSLFASLGNGSGIGYKLCLLEGLYIHNTRNVMLRELDNDYLIFIDSDMSFKPGCIEKLIELDKPVAGGVYLRRLPPYIPFAFNFDNQLIPQLVEPLPEEPFQCDAIATGFMLIKKEVAEFMVEKYNNPFDFISIMSGKKFLGEDMAFCKRLKDNNIELWAHPGLELGHVGYRVIQMNRSDNVRAKVVDIIDNPMEEVELAAVASL